MIDDGVVAAAVRECIVALMLELKRCCSEVSCDDGVDEERTIPVTLEKNKKSPQQKVK